MRPDTYSVFSTGHLYLRLMLPLQSVILMTLISVTELEGPGEEFKDNPLLGEQTGDSLTHRQSVQQILKMRVFAV